MCDISYLLVEDDIILVGVFGGRDKDGRIASIGFIRFDARPTANPPVEVFGKLDVINNNVIWDSLCSPRSLRKRIPPDSHIRHVRKCRCLYWDRQQ